MGNRLRLQGLRSGCHAAGGFTLIELLLAMGISAMIAVLAYAGLNASVQASTRMQAELEQLQQLQRTFAFLEEDLLQFRNRPVTDEFGTLQPALTGGTFNEPLLLLTRGGWPNPARLPRSELLRVQYRLNNEQLIRDYSASIDSSEAGSGFQETVLLEAVERIAVEFLPALRGTLPADMVSLSGTLGGWENYWNTQFQSTPQLPVLPLAVRLTIQVKGIGQVQRVFQLPE